MDNYIVNPQTKRAVKLNGAVHRKLMKEGLVAILNDDNVLSDIPESNVESKINELNKKLPPTHHAVRGRGNYKGKLVKREKPLTGTLVQDIATNLTKKVITENREELLDGDENLDELINDIILREMSEVLPRRSKYYTEEI